MNSQVSGNSQLWAAIVELPYISIRNNGIYNRIFYFSIKTVF